MYITPTSIYYSEDGQCARQADFLILVQPDYGLDVNKSCNAPIRAFIRKVAMRQCGHFMMGRARAHGRKLVLSGTYGADGLTVNVPPELYELALEVPPELDQAWRKSNGWNAAGAEGPAMREWAVSQLRQGRRG